MANKSFSTTKGGPTNPWIRTHMWTVALFVVNIALLMLSILIKMNPELRENAFAMTLAFPMYGPGMMILLFSALFCTDAVSSLCLPSSSISSILVSAFFALLSVVVLLYPTVLGIFIDKIRK